MTHVHIHAPKGHYIGQVRLYGHRKWETVTAQRTSTKGSFGLKGNVKT